MSLWDRIVDAVTVVWLSVFAVGLLSEEWSGFCDSVNLALLPVFVADLGVRYLRVRDVREFLTKHWFDLIIVIPYFRFLRFVRLARVARLSRTGKAVKAPRASGTDAVAALGRAEKFYKAYRKLKRVLRRVKKGVK